jgi:NAD(P)-dependent dehydrogenase (short-subunit alcohol dehydrogenase family)
MGQDLSGKFAVVTGGTRGIGFAIVEALLGEGVAVALSGRSAESVDRALQSLSGKGRVIGKHCDAGRFEEVEAFFQFVDAQFSKLDILVNNAGIGVFGKVDELSPEQWREVIDTNLSGPFYCTRQAVPLMRKAGGGFIVNIGSLAGKHVFAGGSAYNASKFGLAGFTEAIMLDLRQDGIRVTTIMPGSVQTEFGRGSSEDAGWKVLPEHVAETVVHLLQMPARSLASRVEMRPSRPPK